MATSLFRQKYIEACQGIGVEPVGCIAKVEEMDDRLSVSSQTLAVKGSLALGTALKHGEFGEVELCNSYINDEGCKAVCEGLAGNQYLRVLNLSGNNFGANSAEWLANVVRLCPNLKSLSLEWDNMGVSSPQLTVLCDAIASSKSLTHVDLRNNRISPEGIPAICKLISFSTVLVSLDLRWNRLGPRAGDAILTALAKNKVMSSLKLTGNDIEYTALINIEDRVKSNEKSRVDYSASEEIFMKQKEYQEVMMQNAERLQAEVHRRDSHIMEGKQRIGELVSENEGLSAGQQRLKAELENARAEIELLSKGVSEKMAVLREESSEEIAALKSEHKTAVNELKQTIAALEKDLTTSRQTHTASETTNMTLTTKVTILEEQNTTLSTELASVKEKLSEVEFKASQDAILLKRVSDELAAKTEGCVIVQARKAELEEKVLEVERERNALAAQLQRIDLEHERNVQAVRDEMAREKREELDRMARQLREIHEELAGKERVVGELKAEMVKDVQRHQKEIDEMEERVKKGKEVYSILEVESHRMSSVILQLESEKKRLSHEIQLNADRYATLQQEFESSQRQYQADVDRLTERFATDRLDLERKLLQREERASHLDAENTELSQKLKRAADDASREKERLQRRITEQIRVIFEESV